MNENLFFLYGIIVSIICLYIFFGSDIKCNSEPNIKIDIPPFIIKSKIVIFNKHVHHWIIGIIFIVILSIMHLYFDYSIMYFFQSFSIVLVLHGLLYQDCFDFDVE